MRKLYIGYVSEMTNTFKISEAPVWKSDLGYDTKSSYFVSPDVSLQYLRESHFDKELTLKMGIVMYSFDKEKVSHWVLSSYTRLLEEISEKYKAITNTEVVDLSSNLNITDKKCPKCYGPLHESDVEGYDYVCLECDENFFEVEVKESL